MLAALPCLSSAAGPDWVGGYPRLVQKDVFLQWNLVKGADSYRVYRSEGKGKESMLATVKTNRYIDKDAPAGKTFEYSVAAVSADKEAGRSKPASITTAKEKKYVPLAKPKIAGVHVKELAGGKVSVGIRWEGAAGTDLIGVNVYRTKQKGKDYVMIGSSQSDYYDDDDVTRGEMYYYVVTAVDNQFRETGYSNEMSAEVPSLPAARPTPAAAPPPAAKQPEAAKVQPTKMRKTKLLFRIPRKGEPDKDRGELAPSRCQAVAVDEAVGHIYITDVGNHCVLVYDMDGQFQFYIKKDGVSGTDDMPAPMGLFVGEEGNIYVGDLSVPEIRVFSFEGKPVRTMPIRSGEFIGMAHERDRIYISEPYSNSILIYNDEGEFVRAVTGARDADEAKKDGRPVFNGPGRIATVKGDMTFVDTGFGRIELFDRNGKFKRSIGKGGFGAGYLERPGAIAAGPAGEILIGSGMDLNIQAFGKNGDFLYAFCNDKADGPADIMTSAFGMCVDSRNRLYVVGLGRISVLQLLDEYVNVIPKGE